MDFAANCEEAEGPYWTWDNLSGVVAGHSLLRAVSSCYRRSGFAPNKFRFLSFFILFFVFFFFQAARFLFFNAKRCFNSLAATGRYGGFGAGELSSCRPAVKEEKEGVK